MLLNKNAITVVGISNFPDYLVEVEYGYNKLWGSDTGRNMKGSNSGTFLGVFPKLRVTFRKTTQTELEDLAQVLDEANQTVTYYDPKLKRYYTMSTYTGDWATRNRNTFTNVAKANDSFEISFIANEARPLT